MEEQETHSNPEVDIFFVGQTGVGKSSLINMIMGVQDTDKKAAQVSTDARPCTEQTTSYPVLLEPNLQCRLWDTRGLNEAVEKSDNRRLMAKVVDMLERIFQSKDQQEHELQETLRNHIDKQIKPILIWCVDAGKIGIPVPWVDFRRVYVGYCREKVIPVIVVTRMHPKTTQWEEKCRGQLGDMNIRLIRVRDYGKQPSTGYEEDSKALKALVSEVAKVEVDTCREQTADLV